MNIYYLQHKFGRRFAVEGPDAKRALRVKLQRKDWRRIVQFLKSNPRQGLVLRCPPNSAASIGRNLSSFLSDRPMLSLKQRLLDHIAQNGPITFKEFTKFVHTAPAEPNKIGGYYTEGRVSFGDGKHFVTHPQEYSPHYGVALSRFAYHLWKEIGSPSRFEWVEMGGGNGYLCRDILETTVNTAPESFKRAFVYTIVEVSPALIEIQKKQAEGFPVRWINASAQEADTVVECGIFFSNELFDDLPVNKVVVRSKRLREVYVGVDNDRFVETEGELSDKEIEDYFEMRWIKQYPPVDGKPFYVNLEAARLIERIGRNLGIGFVLTVDYGYWLESLVGGELNDIHIYGPRNNPSQNPFASVGELNLTSLVPFGILDAWGRRAELSTALYLQEFHFLRNFCSHFASFEQASNLKFFLDNWVLLQSKNVGDVDLSAICVT